MNQHSTLQMSRLNAASLLAFLYLQDVFWLVLSRLYLLTNPPSYAVMHWEWTNFFAFCAYALFLSALGFFIVLRLKPLPKIRFSRRLVLGLLLVPCLGQGMMILYVSVDARYTSGGLTGSAGLIYALSRALSLGCMVLLLRLRILRFQVPSWVVLTFVLSYIATIDGFASSLTLLTFLILFFPLHFGGVRLVVIWIAILLSGILLANVALIAKWGELRDYMDINFFVTWLVPRFSVQAESMYTFVSGQLQIQSGGDFLNLIMRAIDARIDIVMGNSQNLIFPRSVSEAIHRDVYGSFGAGSSPGALLGSVMLGPLFIWVMPTIFGFLFLQIFYRTPLKMNLLRLAALSFLFKGLHTDSSEYFTVISPTLVYVAFFVFYCLVLPRQTTIPGASRTQTLSE